MAPVEDDTSAGSPMNTASLSRSSPDEREIGRLPWVAGPKAIGLAVMDRWYRQPCRNGTSRRICRIDGRMH